MTDVVKNNPSIKDIAHVIEIINFTWNESIFRIENSTIGSKPSFFIWTSKSFIKCCEINDIWRYEIIFHHLDSVENIIRHKSIFHKGLEYSVFTWTGLRREYSYNGFHACSTLRPEFREDKSAISYAECGYCGVQLEGDASYRHVCGSSINLSINHA